MANKKCDCLAEIERKLNEHHKQSVMLDTRLTVSMKTGEYSSDMQPLWYHFKEGRRMKKSYVKFSHCPFCGVKYEA